MGRAGKIGCAHYREIIFEWYETMALLHGFVLQARYFFRLNIQRKKRTRRQISTHKISEYELQKIAGLVARLQSCQCFRNFFLADAFIIRLHAEPLASTISWTSYLQSTTTSTFFWFVGTTNLFIISDSMHFRLECLSKTSNNRPSGRARKLNISNT